MNYPIILGGKEFLREEKIDIIYPYNNKAIHSISLAEDDELKKAIELAKTGFEKTKNLSSYQKSKILENLKNLVEKEKEDLAKTIMYEAGKPIQQARAEVERCLLTIETAKEEAKRISGKIIPLDLAPWLEGKEGMIKRFPRGIVLAITPFNFPLNLVAHKIAPAIASGCSFILKPSSKCPVISYKFVKLILESGYPKEAVNFLPMKSEKAKFLIENPDVKVVSFTGSSDVGWEIKKLAYDKQVTLELGGNAGVIVHNDGDLELAAKKCAQGGFAYAGQSCISVQRIIVQEDIYENFKEKLIEEVKKLKFGNPEEEDTFIGPVIDEESLKRIEKWVEEAKEGGAKILLGGKREGSFYLPTVIENVKEDMKVWAEEVFAPLVCLKKYKTFEEAIEILNRSKYGLQAGLFTSDYKLIDKAFKEIEVGGLVLNDASSFRADPQPYGGVKKSGFGREGIRWAIEEMTEIKILIK